MIIRASVFALSTAFAPSSFASEFGQFGFSVDQKRFAAACPDYADYARYSQYASSSIP